MFRYSLIFQTLKQIILAIKINSKKYLKLTVKLKAETNWKHLETVCENIVQDYVLSMIL